MNENEQKKKKGGGLGVGLVLKMETTPGENAVNTTCVHLSF